MEAVVDPDRADDRVRVRRHRQRVDALVGREAGAEQRAAGERRAAGENGARKGGDENETSHPDIIGKPEHHRDAPTHRNGPSGTSLAAYRDSDTTRAFPTPTSPPFKRDEPPRESQRLPRQTPE